MFLCFIFHISLLDENELNEMIDDNPIEEEDDEESADEGPQGSRKRKLGKNNVHPDLNISCS